MSPKKRSSLNNALPRNWRRKRENGPIYYRVPAGAEPYWDGKKEFKLGNTLAQAHMEFAKRIGYEGKVVLMDHLCDKYVAEVLPDKAPATRRSNEYSLKRIRHAFEGNKVAAILPMHIYQYRDATGRNESKKKANLDLEVLSHMFTKAIEWGVVHHHPMTNKKVTKFSLKPRRVKVDRAELVAFAATLPRQWQLYISLKLWTGRRKGELLRLTKFDLVETGMRFVNNKNPDDEFVLEWEPETREIVSEVLALPGHLRASYLFHTRNNDPYIKLDGNTSGFDSIWQRYMTAALKSGKVTTRFTEHDLRKVRASDLTLEQAQHFLRHTTSKQTKTYQVEPTVVSIKKSKNQ